MAIRAPDGANNIANATPTIALSVFVCLFVLFCFFLPLEVSRGWRSGSGGLGWCPGVIFIKTNTKLVKDKYKTLEKQIQKLVKTNTKLNICE